MNNADANKPADSGRATDLGHLRHELRTPLNQIIGYSEMLQEEAEATGQTGLVSDLQKIQTAARHLLLTIQTELQGSGALRTADVPAARAQAASPRIDPPQMASGGGRLLAVDDNDLNRDMLSRRLERQGYSVAVADGGRRALEMLRQEAFDLVLLDIMMPDVDGFAVLEQIKGDAQLRHIPVIMISALDEMENVIRCIQIGAEDYLPKPFDPVLLRARIGACLEKKRLRDHEQDMLRQLQEEQERSERLLLNVLPAAIAGRLKAGESTIADNFSSVTVLFADLVGFTTLSGHIAPSELVFLLNEIFSAFDELTACHGLEKIKTIGDAYMVVGGLPEPRSDHAETIARMALEMQTAMGQFNSRYNTSLRIRIGIHTGPVVAGIIGKHKFSYDLWGDTVNIASRMEALSLPGEIQVSAATHELLGDKFQSEPRGALDVKGKGEMRTWFLRGAN